jgi:PPOX class probable F420-dependent enzyme
MGALLAQFEGQKHLSIETYRRNGEPVRTPVWFIEDGAVFYVRTAVSTGKYKRIRNNPSVRIAPCDSRGNVKGEWLSAEASIAPEPEFERVYRLLRKKYGMMYAVTTAFMRGKTYVVLLIRAKDQ